MSADARARAAALIMLQAAPLCAQDVSWSLRADNAGSSDSTMAYDAARGVAVCFTGYPNAPQTIEWNGSVWTPPVSIGPALRFGNGLIFDSSRALSVLFGGTVSTGMSGETWEWSGSQWTRRAGPGPAPREYPAFAYDAGRGVGVLFGGAAISGGSPTLQGETWEWNGVLWTMRSVPEPSPRTLAAMVYDTRRRVCVMFGGAVGGTVSAPILSAQTWTWDGSNWADVSTPGPSPRGAFAMAFDSRRKRVVLFGGWTLGPSGPVNNAETWEWNGTWSQRVIPGPTARQNHSMAFDTRRSVTVLHGGQTDTGFSRETWELVPTAPLCPADTDDGSRLGTPDGAVTIDDLIYFLVAFEDGSLDADLDADGVNPPNPDGAVTIDDLVFFLLRFEAGC